MDIRNKECTVETLLGVSNAKEFIPSIANTIGTDMSNYKVITKGQFAYVTVTSRNGDKLSVALMQNEEAIVSQAYTVFEVADKSELLPDYLMMWFRRPEFDRYVRFKSHGSAREIFDWEEMCEVPLPIPDIEEQREIVAQYEAITRRIALNERICANLEETAQALYNKMFVQDIAPDNLPDGWRMGTLDEIATFRYGQQTERHDKSEKYMYPVYSGYAITGYSESCNIYEPTIVIIARGNSGTGEIRMTPSKCFLSNLAISIVVPHEIKDYLYYFLSQADTMSLRSGSAQAQITISSLELFDIILPPNKLTLDFKLRINPIRKYREELLRENEILYRIMDFYINNLKQQ
ncbi:restriction endonuclease subunit S [Porphyromonas asaccharolytica]|uniref:restriction endonuclease subunit S n=1 Tax=Porphyromonas asaccharolytica TaxID=28123 RepID=UPI00248DA072|nr:restriction endonuclease subunit S [Porphyromonas asaccharolytica]